MKRILIVSRYFHPEMSPRAHRTTELALELDRTGQDVEVALPDSDYKRAKPIDYTKMAEVQNTFRDRYLSEVR